MTFDKTVEGLQVKFKTLLNLALHITWSFSLPQKQLGRPTTEAGGKISRTIPSPVYLQVEKFGKHITYHKLNQKKNVTDYCALFII